MMEVFCVFLPSSILWPLSSTMSQTPLCSHRWNKKNDGALFIEGESRSACACNDGRRRTLCSDKLLLKLNSHRCAAELLYLCTFICVYWVNWWTFSHGLRCKPTLGTTPRCGEVVKLFYFLWNKWDFFICNTMCAWSPFVQRPRLGPGRSIKDKKLMLHLCCICCSEILV